MYQPEPYGIALSIMILGMLCWGSWANSMKLCQGYRFQRFYWVYVIGLIVGAIAWGAAVGVLGAPAELSSQILLTLTSIRFCLYLSAQIQSRVSSALPEDSGFNPLIEEVSFAASSLYATSRARVWPI
jgi:hypothetical protein